MVRFSADIASAASLCLAKRVPFCLYAFPGEEAPVTFFSNPSGVAAGHRRRFIIGQWKESFDKKLSIHEELDAQETLEFLADAPNFPEPAVEPWAQTTSKPNYRFQISKLIAAIKEEKLGKVVISKTQALRNNKTDAGIVEGARALFSAYPNSFRSLYYTPATGAWIGATPELLVDYNAADGRLATMALAGTRQATVDPETPWSAKNVEEQAIVASYIATELQGLGFTVSQSQPHTLVTGTLQHICTDITARFGHSTPPAMSRVVDAINPTPALCGYPKLRAEELIERIEQHPRRCYGGLVGVVDAERLTAYVNLRCAHFNETSVCIYAGGGILAKSVAGSEWEEAERKMLPMKKVFTDYTPIEG